MKRSTGRPVRVSDLRGTARLAVRATTQVADMAEGVHRAVGDTIGLPGGSEAGRTRGVTGFVYRSVRSIARWSGRGVEAGLAGLERLLPGDDAPDSRRRQVVLAVLNGVMGDQLAADESPLALPMTLRSAGGSALFQDPSTPEETGSRNVLLMIHGLCLSDFAWQPEPDKEEDRVDLGRSVSEALGSTPIYLRYNSGLHISQNGRRLSALLEELVASRPVARLDVVAHSMGGLVLRSALHYAEEEGRRWPRTVENLVFLGTPHHGAPLEKIGSHLDALLGAGRWTLPFRRLGRLRSAGITDLRHGNVRDEDWRGRDRFDDRHDTRSITPLPEGIACRAVAATLASRRGAMADHLLGDGLVTLHSALGRHADPTRCLDFPEACQRIFYGTGHNDLLIRPQTAEQLIDWLRS